MGKVPSGWGSPCHCHAEEVGIASHGLEVSLALAQSGGGSVWCRPDNKWPGPQSLSPQNSDCVRAGQSIEMVQGSTRGLEDLS